MVLALALVPSNADCQTRVIIAFAGGDLPRIRIAGTQFCWTGVVAAHSVLQD